jgi:uncharacterized membrane protein
MVEAETHHPVAGIHPIQAVLLASMLPLSLGAVLSDYAYAQSYEIQWTNFASWLVAGGLVFAALALVWATIDLFRVDLSDRRKPLLYWMLLLATFIVGLGNALVHGKDAWAAMPAGLVLSVIVLILVVATIAVAFSTLRGRIAQ